MKIIESSAKLTIEETEQMKKKETHDNSKTGFCKAVNFQFAKNKSWSRYVTNCRMEIISGQLE